jgi:hypothetical protein
VLRRNAVGGCLALVRRTSGSEEMVSF